MMVSEGVYITLQLQTGLGEEDSGSTMKVFFFWGGGKGSKLIWEGESKNIAKNG